MPGDFIQRWTMGAGGFIGEVSLFKLSAQDEHIAQRFPDTVELSDLYVHPLRRGKGWARILLRSAIAHAAINEWNVFIRVIPYGKEPIISLEDLIAFYKQHGFKHINRRDRREMLLCLKAK